MAKEGTIPVTAEVYEKLEKRAAKLGKTVDDYANEICLEAMDQDN